MFIGIGLDSIFAKKMSAHFGNFLIYDIWYPPALPEMSKMCTHFIAKMESRPIIMNILLKVFFSNIARSPIFLPVKFLYYGLLYPN